VKPEDLSRLRQPGGVALDPSGSKVAFVVSIPDVDEDAYQRSIWIADSGGVEQFTSGPRDSLPRFSPDGDRIAFLRSPDEGKPAQVAVIPVHGGEARVLTDFEFGAEGLEWSPDGSSLAATAVTPASDWEDVDEDERKRRPRRITQVPYRFDNMGWRDDRRRHIWLVDPSGSSEPRCLTPGEFDETFPAWSPDGQRIAFLTDRDPARGLTPGNEIMTVEVATGAQEVAVPRGFWVMPSYRPDGALHVLGDPSLDYPLLLTLHRVEADGSTTPLTAHLDRSSVSLAGGPPFVCWDGTSAIVALEDSGKTGLVSVAPDGAVSTLIDQESTLTSADAAGGRIVYTATTWDNPGEVYEVGGDSPISNLNTETLDLVEPHHFRAISDGHEIDVWVLLPEGDGPVPLLLNIHGGPASQYGFGFFDEFQIYASAGYGVVACNPRGSSGRGLDFLRAVIGDGWGAVDMTDIEAAVDTALERFPRLDPGRMGIMGGSYGGFMTAWMIANEDRWQSAVVERALTNFVSFAGTSDIGGTFPYYYTRANYPDWDTWWAKSPLAYVDRVSTPTLVLHSENDFRCPIEQGEQYFMALLRNGTPTEMVRFPGEGHELTRSGKPKHRKERFDIVLDWHSRHLV
jgi:dipeptidyl aminopeptidase/acylaminoacyl peptidase